MNLDPVYQQCGECRWRISLRENIILALLSDCGARVSNFDPKSPKVFCRQGYDPSEPCREAVGDE